MKTYEEAIEAMAVEIENDRKSGLYSYDELFSSRQGMANAISVIFGVAYAKAYDELLEEVDRIRMQ